MRAVEIFLQYFLDKSITSFVYFRQIMESVPQFLLNTFLLSAKITIKDVAKEAGVGVGTVSRVLNNSASVRDSTRRLVLAAIDSLDYQPNPIAQRLSRGKTNSVAVIAPFFTMPSFVERLRGIVSVFSESDYDFVLHNVDSERSRDKYFRELSRAGWADGVLIMALTPTHEQAERFTQSGVPTVLVDADHDAFDRIVIDDYFGGYLATKHLLDLGHQRIGMILDSLVNVPYDNNVTALRHSGFVAALAEHSIPLRSAYLAESAIDRQEAMQAALKMLSMPDRPTAIFSYSDTQALGIIQAATELNIRIPEDLSLIGYDDIELAEFMNLTTMRQNLFDVGAAGATLLLEKMLPADSDLPVQNDDSSKKIVISPELVVRSTTTAV